ncbi:MAG: hypothetical protein IJ109_07090 [Firmicutes bacterium]|nr:hypothetical protein [Bacillota bacterium]
MDLDIIKRRIEKRVKSAFAEYQAQEDVQTKFAEPAFGYISTIHPMFDTFFARGENDHPKNIWRPGYTMIVYYIPFAEDIPRFNEADGTPNPAWLKAIEESRWLAMKVNAAIVEILTKVGRIYSRSSTMMDWDHEKHRYGWNNNIAGYLAGIGTFGPAGSLITEYGYGGRVGTMMTDGVYVKKPETVDGAVLDAEFQKVMTACCYAGARDVHCSQEMIAACPGGAIAEDGIDRGKCQAYCETINKADPCPQMCGRCFGFR